MSHTPTPWSYAATAVPGDYYILAEDGQGPGDGAGWIVARVAHHWRAETTDKANAEFIVRAVNCHDDLLEALETALELLNDCGSGEEEAEAVAKACNVMFSAVTKAKGGAS